MRKKLLYTKNTFILKLLINVITVGVEALVCRLCAQPRFVLRNNEKKKMLRRATRAQLEHFNWELFDHLPYSPDHAPSDYYLIAYLKY
jgi:hypothetical protein